MHPFYLIIPVMTIYPYYIIVSAIRVISPTPCWPPDLTSTSTPQVNKFLSEQAQAREDLDRIREQRENETRLNVDNMRKAFEVSRETPQIRPLVKF